MVAAYFESLCLSLLCTVFKLAHFAMLYTDIDDSWRAIETFVSQVKTSVAEYLSVRINLVTQNSSECFQTVEMCQTDHAFDRHGP